MSTPLMQAQIKKLRLQLKNSKNDKSMKSYLDIKRIDGLAVVVAPISVEDLLC